MIGVLLAHNLEHVHGVFGSMWNKEERPGMITRPPNFGERFGVSLNRWPNNSPESISFCPLNFNQLHAGFRHGKGI